MRRVLIPYDFSAPAVNALRYALALLDGRPVTFVLLYVERPAEQHDACQGFRSIIADSATDPDQHWEHAVIPADMVDEGIAAYSTLQQIDLVIMGSDGKHEMRSRILGSVTSGVIERCACPVLAVPAMAEYRSFSKMVLGTDLRPVEHLGHYDDLLDFMGLANTALTVVNVETAARPVNIDSTINGEDNSVMVFLDRPHHTEFIYDSSPAEGLLNYVEEQQADILLMLKRDHYMIRTAHSRSVVSQTVMEISVPLLSFPCLPAV